MCINIAVNISGFYGAVVERNCSMTVWPSGLRRWLKAPVRKGVGSNPTAVKVDELLLQRHASRY